MAHRDMRCNQVADNSDQSPESRPVGSCARKPKVRWGRCPAAQTCQATEILVVSAYNVNKTDGTKWTSRFRWSRRDENRSDAIPEVEAHALTGRSYMALAARDVTSVKVRIIVQPVLTFGVAAGDEEIGCER